MKKIISWISPYSEFGTHTNNIKALMKSEQSYKYLTPEKIEYGEVIFVPKEEIENIKTLLNERNLFLTPDEDVEFLDGIMLS